MNIYSPEGTSNDIENMLESELEKVEFYRAVQAVNNSVQNREYYQDMIISRQQNATRLLYRHIVENSKLEPSRMKRAKNPVYATTKNVRYSNEYIKEDLRIPVLKGAKNERVQRQINTSIESDIMEFKRQMEEAAKEEAEEAKRTGKKFIPYSISDVYNITYNENNILSVTLLYNEYVGGKNYYIKTPYNYDLTTGKSLAIGDLFKPGIDYKTLVNNEIRKHISNNPDKYLPGTLQNFKGIAEDQPFYLEDNYLNIFFGFHEIAPREAQIPVIKLPLSLFSNALKPGLI